MTAATSLHERFQNALTHRYFIRLHMTVMMGMVLSSGLLLSRILVRAGVTNMGVRYPIAVLFSYLAFFVLVRIWIAYVTRAARKRQRNSGSWDVGDLVPQGPGNLSGGSARAAGRLVEGGGKFGGAGSSASFADGEAVAARQVVPVVPIQPAAAHSGSGSSSSSGFGIDLDGDGLWLLILFAVLVAAIFGAGAYLIYQAPVILPEAAFQAALAPGLVKTARNSHDPGWMESVLKKTVIPFALVLVFAGIFGQQAHKRCPGAATVRQVFRQCIFRR